MRRLLLNLALLLALVSTCQAQRFLPTNCTALVDLLPAPPADDSPAGRADLETVLQVQTDRTPEQVKRAKRVASQSLTSFVRPVLREWFHSPEVPRTTALFDDRMDAPTKSGLKPQLAELQATTKEELRKPGGAGELKD